MRVLAFHKRPNIYLRRKERNGMKRFERKPQNVKEKGGG